METALILAKFYNLKITIFSIITYVYHFVSELCVKIQKLEKKDSCRKITSKHYLSLCVDSLPIGRKGRKGKELILNEEEG